MDYDFDYIYRPSFQSRTSLLGNLIRPVRCDFRHQTHNQICACHLWLLLSGLRPLP
ncbi:hypothetical protein HanXRQr2_Chr07g0297581 [Helianthus annuus]|uniref:Uncharacterized protein n=1 Tax=Helianthus annuus TaxID=4232 RepID=A0A9K3IKS1_HELAN|nr:hypothetical protein HanXRQr2_Chr07g0297581 [Helianthus annuus]KAJ0904934.1 hypothetical protein HanPSC8_Chr07g0288101 [Helianthus annuus]